MWPFKRQQEYHAVVNEDEELKDFSDAHKPTAARPRRPVGLPILVVSFSIFANLVIETLAYHVWHSNHYDTATMKIVEVASKCPTRHEWRTLMRHEQKDYISAVICLLSLHSALIPSSEQTAYGDFPWVHRQIGYSTHNSAPFLPWHRYFLHKGNLVYRDWTLPWKALEKSPGFDPDTGFGSDGEVGGEANVGRSRKCVVDGPFANVNVSVYDVEWQPHCLSRGFRNLDGKLGHTDGRDASPKSIEQVLSVKSYEDFVASTESQVHNAIPSGIAGDFETFTAPYDPLFFLHHTQLDRIWWLWQRQPRKGLKSYGGHKQRHSIEMASLDDDLKYHALVPDVTVKDVMDVENELLCYRY